MLYSGMERTTDYDRWLRERKAEAARKAEAQRVASGILSGAVRLIAHNGQRVGSK